MRYLFARLGVLGVIGYTAAWFIGGILLQVARVAAGILP